MHIIPLAVRGAGFPGGVAALLATGGAPSVRIDVAASQFVEFRITEDAFCAAPIRADWFLWERIYCIPSTISRKLNFKAGKCGNLRPHY